MVKDHIFITEKYIAKLKYAQATVGDFLSERGLRPAIASDD